VLTDSLSFQDKYSEPLRNYIKSSKLNHIPTPIEYFGYIFFFPNYLAGPVQTVKEYLNYMDGTTFKEFGGSIPLLSSVWASVKIFLYALVVVVGVYLKALSPIGYTATEEFLTHTIFYRFGPLFGC
jgi:D-alanyl-lipoteichoic acid acyltransferase DltB (MBOAT superfamily)